MLLLPGGTSGEIAVHVVATFLFACLDRCGAKSQPLWPSDNLPTPPTSGCPRCGTAQPVTNKLPSMWLILKHRPKHEQTEQPCRLPNVLHVFNIHRSLTRAACSFLFPQCSIQLCPK